MDVEEREFIENVNIDKARNKIIWCVVFTIINLLTYIVPFFDGYFDFGIFFEIATLICIFIARFFMKRYDVDNSRRFIIFAAIPIGWLFVYDLIMVLSYISDAYDFVYLGGDFIINELLTILTLRQIFKIIKNLRKADNPEKYKENTDWFYERLNKEKNEKNNLNSQ